MPRPRQLLQMGRSPEHLDFLRRHASQAAVMDLALDPLLLADELAGVLFSSCCVRGGAGAKGTRRRPL